MINVGDTQIVKSIKAVNLNETTSTAPDGCTYSWSYLGDV